MRDDLLGPQGEPRGVFCRQRERLIERVRVQRLRSPQDGGQGLDRDADDIVIGLLRGKRASGSLRMETENGGSRVRDT